MAEARMSDRRLDLDSETAMTGIMNEPTNVMPHGTGRPPQAPGPHAPPQATQQTSTRTSGGTSGYGEEWPPVWFSLVQHEWTSIVLVPARPGMSTLGVARALAAAGRLYEERTVCCLEAEHVPPTAVRKVIADLRDRSATGERTVVAVSSPLDDHGAVPIARAADAAVLVVPLGEAGLAEAKKTIAAIGAGSFIGAITVSAR
jgi:hypothetical protein